MNQSLYVLLAVWLAVVGFPLQATLLEKELVASRFKKLSTLPLIYECDQFLSDQECESLIQRARPTLTRSTVVDVSSATSIPHDYRTSLGTYFKKSEEGILIKKIRKKIEKITGISQGNGEPVQILYYGIGGEYKPHYDYFDPTTTGGLYHVHHGGQRLVTCIFYLHTTEEGGETIFPKKRIKIKPTKGKALLFYNVDQNGAPLPLSLHGGSPVILGEKWIMTLWLREKVYN